MAVMAEHLARMAALDALVAATALKAAVWVNALGPGAAHATAVAKYACTVMAEEAVTEGRRLFGSRALVAEYDYERLVRDVTLYPVFDGTAHVMLDQLQWRLAQFASQGNHDGDSLAFARAAYTGPPRHLSIAARERGRPYLVSIAQRLGAWRSHEAGNDVEPYARAAEVLLAVVRSLRDGNVWEERQSLRFEAGDMLARLEAIAALLELGNGPRRAALGIARPLHGADDVFARFAAPWMGARIVSCMEQWVKEHRIPRPPALDGLMDAMVEPLGTARSEAYAVLRQNVAAEGCT
jgi:hypothetical protein